MASLLMRGSLYLLLLSLLMAPGCKKSSSTYKPEPGLPQNAVPGQGPVWGFLDKGNRVVFYPRPGTLWQELVRLEVFEGFYPDITFEEALARFGPPSRKGEGPYGPYWIYKVSAGEVQVSHEEQGSPPGPYTKWWILRGYPVNRSVSDVFVPEAAGHIPADLKGIEVVIMGSDNIPVLRAQVEAGQVVEMTWRR